MQKRRLPGESGAFGRGCAPLAQAHSCPANLVRRGGAVRLSLRPERNAPAFSSSPCTCTGGLCRRRAPRPRPAQRPRRGARARSKEHGGRRGRGRSGMEPATTESLCARMAPNTHVEFADRTEDRAQVTGCVQPGLLGISSPCKQEQTLMQPILLRVGRRIQSESEPGRGIGYEIPLGTDKQNGRERK